MKTSPSEVPIANEELYAITARMTRANKSTVKSIIHFVGAFTADTIRSDDAQSVMIPYFGKFMPLKERIFANNQRKTVDRSDAGIVMRAIAGLPPKPTDKDETV